MANLNSSYNQYLQASIGNPSAANGNSFTLARVTHVIQGPFYVGTTIPDPYYTDPTSLGSVAFQIVNSPQTSTLTESGNVIAKPIFSGFKQYPVEGELVYIIPGPSVEMNETRGARSYYYLPPYNLWGNSHHNAFPDLRDVKEFTSTAVDRTYEGSFVTNQPANTGTTGSTVFPLGPNFVEKDNIKNLRQFSGDVTVEGRWGNSIRLGSTSLTAPSGIQENNWSRDSAPGNPIILIRNGQGKSIDNLPWFPTVEDINTDPSSIYLTQGQRIVIDDIQKNFSLASLSVKLETVQSIIIPVQQQLTSTTNTSAIEQDNLTNSITSPPPDITPLSQNPVQSNITPSTVLRVVGDYQDLSFIDGTFVISLRTVDPAGNILSSVSKTGSTATEAYTNAVSEIKNKNPDVQLTIPTLISLIN